MALIERSLHRAVVLSVAVFVAGFSATGFGQPCQIAPETVTAVGITTDQEAEISRCVRENAADLTSADAAKRRASRLALLRPLENSGASANFRFAYARALISTLESALQSTDDRVAVNALVVAGDVATDSTTSLLIASLKSDRPALRYDAAYGLRRTFEAMVRSAPAVNPDNIGIAINALRDRTAVESDGQVLKACVAALLAATDVPSNHAPTARADATAALCVGLGTHVKGASGKAAEPAVLDAYLKGVDGVRIVLARPGIAITATEAKAACELSGRCAAYGVRILRSKGLAAGESESREVLSNTIAASETLLGQAALSLSAGVLRLPRRDLGDKFSRAVDVNSEVVFINEASAVVGSEGLLSKPPFDFPKGHFLP
ncbi:hypothetical protein PHYC_02307 [Phycisphaerales bacterium]|nr:hypothetical protein PHYC_02307 [Phycisphaerales bacterium]